MPTYPHSDMLQHTIMRRYLTQTTRKVQTKVFSQGWWCWSDHREVLQCGGQTSGECCHLSEHLMKRKNRRNVKSAGVLWTTLCVMTRCFKMLVRFQIAYLRGWSWTGADCVLVVAGERWGRFWLMEKGLCIWTWE